MIVRVFCDTKEILDFYNVERIVRVSPDYISVKRFDGTYRRISFESPIIQEIEFIGEEKYEEPEGYEEV